MPPTVPHRFLFRYSFPVLRVDGPPAGGETLALAEEFALPDLGELDEAASFAELRLGWHEAGLAVRVEVRGKKHPPAARANQPTEPDGVQIWIDTRNTQSIHRASRFCHHFCVLPVGGGSKGDEPVAVQLPIARARDDAPIAEPEQLATSVETLDDGYRLGLWLPAEALVGYDPGSSGRLGFYYAVRDSELGDQYLTVGPEFPFAHDPSLWSTVELTS